MELMVLLVLSSSDCYTKYEVEGKISSVVVESLSTYHLFMEGDMVSNKDWLGL